MDDRFDQDQDYAETRYPRRERATIDSATRYPVREERQTLRSHSPKQEEPHVQMPVGEETQLWARQERHTSAEAEPRYERRQESHREEEWGETRIPRRERREEPMREMRADRQQRSGREEQPARRAAGSGNAHNNGRRSGGRKPEHRKKRHLTGFAKGLIVLVIALVIGVISFVFMNHLMNPPEEEMNLTGETVTVTIPEGSGTEDIAKILKEKKLIGSVFGFKMTSKLEGYDGTYKQGTYDIDTGLTKRQIMELLQSGKVSANLKVTIPEGYTVKQIAERVAETKLCTAEDFLKEANTGTFDYDFLKDLPEREYPLEGYLFPDTYFLQEGMTAHDIIDLMLKRFDQMYTEEYRKAVEASDYTLDEIVTIASMVEKEIKVAEERPRAAGVIYNRLKEDMSLGIDATVLYAVGKNSGELTKEDLNTDSPYNTRLHKGLPLGPIANPGEASFNAALFPEENKYLYYVVEAAGKENHVFCETYEEFLAAKEAYNASGQ